MRKIIIIGATSGIGRELARLYIQNGDRVGITGRRAFLLDELREQFPLQLVTECFDVTGCKNIPHLESLIQKLGGVDVLIYNSGYGQPTEGLDWVVDRQITLTNVYGFVEIVNYAYNYFRKQGRGQIVATSSIAALRENSHAPAYSASKAFISMYMGSIYLKAGRLKKRNPEIDISITDILPGFVKTKMARSKKLFWEAPLDKAARQIFNAIQKKKRKVYITHRWAIIAWLLKWMPFFILKRLA